MEKEKTARYDLPRFADLLVPHARTFPRMTFWRYVHGYLPTTIQFLVRNPELLQALADDAADIKAKENQSKA